MGTTPAAQPWTIARLLNWTTDYFVAAGLEDARLCAELLLAHALECRKIELYTRFDREPTEEQRAALRDLVRRAAAHEPVAYLVGHKEFYSLRFDVSPAVLIPRPETETLVEQAILYCRGQPAPEFHLLDFGTGSGCIAISILKQVPAARAVATDVSPAALEVARRNAERHGVLDRLTLLELDGLDLPPGVVPAGGFDVLVSNPPYIAENELPALPENVRLYEPRLALSAGADGLFFYRMIGRRAASLLRPGACVLVEIGAGMAEAVKGVFAAEGTWSFVRALGGPGESRERVLHFTH